MAPEAKHDAHQEVEAEHGGEGKFETQLGRLTLHVQGKKSIPLSVRPVRGAVAEVVTSVLATRIELG